jgi:subtilisin family serine protease
MQLAPDGSPIVTLPPDLISGVQTFAAPENMWHLPKSIFGPIHALEKGDFSKVAVLDTGMNSHDELPEPDAAESFIRGENWRDGNGHGTHCAGTVLGTNVGVAPNSRLVVGKVLSNSGSGSSAGITEGILWAIEQDVDIISMSLGSSSPYQPTKDAMIKARDKGILIVCAAGNAGFNGSRNTIGYPGRDIEACLCIGAYAENGERASFSSGGRELDICCPGQNIISCSTTNGYRSMSGTSMATPFCAGLLALINSRNKREGGSRLTLEEVRNLLAKYSTDKGPTGKDPYWGIGIPNSLDLIKALVSELTMI